VKRCEACGAEYDGAITICPLDRAPLVDSADPFVGATIGGYRVAARIGDGSLARVYRATSSSGVAALKLLSPNVARSPVLRERFVREGRAASRLDHPNVARVLACGEDAGVAFLAMELLEGEPLDRVLSRGPLHLGWAVAIAHALAEALAHAHERGVIHRDLKPANVFFTSEKRTKLLDFGLAKVRGEERLTTTGALCGTPATMAPEQVDGRAVTPATDLYALGCVLFHMIAGRPPFVGAASAVLAAHADQRPPHLEAPPKVTELLLALLAKSPDQRPASALAVAQSLSVILR
jgi:serine/threonine-protein kinase